MTQTNINIKHIWHYWQENHNVRQTTLLQWLSDRGLYPMDTQSFVHASTE